MQLTHVALGALQTTSLGYVVVSSAVAQSVGAASGVHGTVRKLAALALDAFASSKARTTWHLLVQ